ncbi:GIY-YIG nuclease family protein [Candidatus Roizmanbacteria bacterium]|nr:GIY-YIG nuclease family protein [Candidatus Roizmanbacteria bacterium]
MFYYVYILLSLKDKNLYVGYSSNLKRRILQHENGKTNSLKNRRPLKLIYYEAFLNKKDAQIKEKFYKSGRGHEVIYKMLANGLS